MCIFVSVWTLLITGYNWALSIGWWLILFGLLVTYSLAIPDYLVEDKKKKHSIWRKRHLSNELKKTQFKASSVSAYYASCQNSSKLVDTPL